MAEEDVYSMFDDKYHAESWLPPPESGHGEGDKDSWDGRAILVDAAAYMIDQRNHTTACCPVTRRSSAGDTNSGGPTRFLYEPRILASEGNLVIIGLKHCTLLNEPSTYIHFVYRAPTLDHDSPELRRLTHPGDEVFPCIDDCYLPHGEVGNIVITIGRVMCWVDLWHGILLYDVHVPSGEEESPSPRPLRYIPLPEPLQPYNDLYICGFSSFFRDIAVVQGRIKFVDVQIHALPGSRIPNGWTAVTWSMAASDPDFRKDVELHSRDLVNGACLEPSLFVAHPMLSSRDDDVLYLMAKASLDDRPGKRE